MDETNIWKKCSRCKSPIAYGSPYYVCSVSTCNGQRTGYVFCRHLCFEAHLPGARHRDAGAVEQKAPQKSPLSSAAERPPERKIIANNPASTKEILIIASRLKEYIDARSGFNTSGQVLEILSDAVRALTDRAIDSARSEGRKTVMDRDFKR